MNPAQGAMIDRQELPPGSAEDTMADRVLSRILHIQAQRLGDAPFLDICGRSVSFAGIDRLSNQLAHGLRELGVAQGDRVAILLPNCLEFIATWFAAAKLGAIEVPSNPDLRGDLLTHNLHSCGAHVLVTDGTALQEIARLQPSLPLIRTLILIPR